ncbi:TPA: type VI secretion system protein TssA [Escherichia coli]
MDLRNPDVWLAHLLENLPEDKLSAALDDGNADWEFVDSEIVKLGSLAHSQLDIPELQRRGLMLLASETKDFRLLAHLLRTLQHAGDILLASRMLAQYTEHYWTCAAPQNMAHKKRFAAQVIKRFESAVQDFAGNAATIQRDALLGELAKLAQCWQAHNAPELAKATDDLFALFQRAFRDVAPEMPSSARTAAVAPQATAGSVPDMSPHTVAAQPPVAATPIPQVTVDSHDDKAWRDTLLKVAAILCERQPESPQGYRLRRHALWQTITSTPQAESDGRTPLAAFPVDMMDDYLARLNNADMALWQQVEKSLLLAPYWLDGHYLSAQTALRLGYKQVADAIRDEVTGFLARLPALINLLFNDRTPFVSEQTKQWLASSGSVNQTAPVVQTDEELQAARACFDENGLETALRYQQLTELHRYLLAIQNSPVPGKSALKAVQLRLDQNSSDPIFATRQMAKTLPAPLNRWVGKLADQAWHVVMVEAVRYMEVDWRDNVVKPFNEQLADNYPFNPRAPQDASLDSFERFFKPDGILDNFYKNNLRLFLENDLTFGDDGRVLIREDIRQQLDTAQKIRDIFFSQQNGLGAQFAVETVSLSGNKRRSVLNLDGQLVDYSQGRNYTAHLVWPNNMREGNESKLTLIGTSGRAPRSIAFSGPWAQFRLFGAGQLTNVTSDTFNVRFNVDGGAMVYRVHVDTEDNPFTGGLFSLFRLPDTLY